MPERTSADRITFLPDDQVMEADFSDKTFEVSGQVNDFYDELDRRIEANDPSCIPYSLSKKALADFTRAAALALAPRIRLGGVCPGPVLPPPGEGLSYLADHAGTVPLASYPTPDQIADAVLYLIRQEGSTGQVLYVDGGQHLLGNGV